MSAKTVRRPALATALFAIAWLMTLAVGPLTAPGAAQLRTTSGTLSGRGTLLIANRHTLSLRNAVTGAERTALTLSSDEFIYAPHWLPGGSAFVFVHQTVFTGDRSADYGSDIWEANADGSNVHPLWAHDAKGADINGLAVPSDGSWLLFGYIRTDVSASGQYVGQVLEVRRLDLATHHITTVVDQAGDPAISPDGSTIVYLNIGEADQSDFGLWTSNADGSGARPLVTVQQNLLVFALPRFSPDGSMILFSSAPNPVSPSGPAGWIPRPHAPVFGAASALADGPAQDVFIVGADGTGLRRLTTIQEDQPSAAWSTDGSEIAVFGSTGFYLLNADGSNFTRLGDGYLHAQIDWLDR